MYGLIARGKENQSRKVKTVLQIFSKETSKWNFQFLSMFWWDSLHRLLTVRWEWHMASVRIHFCSVLASPLQLPVPACIWQRWPQPVYQGFHTGGWATSTGNWSSDWLSLG